MIIRAKQTVGRWPLLALAWGVLLLVGACADIPPEPQVAVAPAATPDAPKPDIVVIVSDDQRWDTLWAMPTVRRELAAEGITFENGYVSNPLCCPSRASILTGQYSHSNGVYTNQGRMPYGGFEAFDDRSTVGTWLHDVGYRTALIGKYLNGYEGPYVPPGWDRWFTTYDKGAFYEYRATVDGVMKRYGTDRPDYGTDVLAGEAVRFIESTPADTPLFLYYGPHAPHEPATPAPGDGNTFSDLPRWRPPSYDEADISDKPAYIRDNLPLDEEVRGRIDAFHLRQYRSLLAVDRSVGEIVEALRESGRLANTLIMYISDNGMLWGEHRWHTKLVPFEESIRVPFVVRFDAAIQSRRTDQHFVLNIDLAPTIAAAAGIAAPGADGMSLFPLFDDAAGPWREAFLIEHMEKSSTSVPTYCGIHTERDVFVRYVTGEEELYDLERDPNQLENLAGLARYEERRRALELRLRNLCDPVPPGFAW